MDEEQQIMEKSPMLDLSQEGLSASSEDGSLYDVPRGQQKSPSRSLFVKFYPILGHLIILCIYTTIIFTMNERPSKLRFKTELSKFAKSTFY
jgi:hypothetical protein